MLEFATQTISSAHRVTLAGEPSIDSGGNFRNGITEALSLGQRRIIVDCGAWNQIDFRVLSTLIRCAALCVEHGADFELVNLADHLRLDIVALRLEGRLGLRA